MKRPEHIYLRILLVAMLLVTALAPAMSQNTVYAGQTTNLTVTAVPGEAYLWELYDNVTSQNLALVPGNCPVTEAFFVGNIITGPVVQVTWLVPGTYYFKVTATTNCTNNIAIGEMIVLNPLPTAVLSVPAAICVGDSVHLTATLTGTAPWSITLTDGTNNWIYSNIAASPYNLTVPVIPLASTTYWISTVSDAYGTNTTPSPPVLQVVNPLPVTSQIYHP